MIMNKIIVITGTRKGIGRYLTEYYLEKGFTVIGCSRSPSDIIHDNYEHYCLDVADEPSVIKMIGSIVKNHKRIDYLLNNAGIASMNHSLLTPLKTVEQIFRTNFYGTFLFCREVGKVMSRNKFGRIVNFTTVAVPLRIAGESVYAASKAAVESFTRILAKEFGKNGITCNAVGPSPIMTDLIKNVDKSKIQLLLEQQAIPRFAEFGDVAGIIDFFLSENSKMVTGQIIYLGGIS